MDKKQVIRDIAMVLLGLAAGMCLLFLSRCVGANSITITDTCPNYSVNNAQGVLSISCGTGPTTPPTTPPPSSSIHCAAYQNTIVLKFPYVPDSGQKTIITDGMTANDIIVAVFTTPPAPYAGGSPLVAVSNQEGVVFTAAMSSTPCSFPSPKSDPQSVSFHPVVKPSTTYYLNILGTTPLWVKLTAR